MDGQIESLCDMFTEKDVKPHKQTKARSIIQNLNVSFWYDVYIVIVISMVFIFKIVIKKTFPLL
jgi:hypothetical protein